MVLPGHPAAPSARSVNASYTPLFTVQFRHGYYNASGGKCPDFKVVPTPDCMKRMSSLGMLFKDLGGGFVVMVASSRVLALTAYLERVKSSAGCWSWLSFLLVPSNPDFIGFTSLPIDTNPMQQNLHLSNLATEADGAALAIAGTGTAQTWLPVTGPSLTVRVPRGALAILTDLSGTPVHAAATAGGTSTTFDLTGLPYGYYTASYANNAGKPARPPKGAPAAWLYLAAAPPSLCLLDLLLAQPGEGIGDPAAFPVSLQAGAGSIQGVTLVVSFAARTTYWRYYIVPQSAAQLGDNLAISGTGTDFRKSREQLPNGDQAVLFTASAPLALSQLPAQRFALSGQRHGANGSRDDIAIGRLPTASPSPVWPASSGDALAGSSEIYVYV